MSRHRFSVRKEKLSITLGGIFILGLIGAGWFPRSCSLLQRTISSCPAPRVVHLTDLPADQQEIARIPHQVIDRPNVVFAIKAQDYRGTTEVKFSYHGSKEYKAYLGIRVNNVVQQLALITHPLLVNLLWSRYSTVLPNITLYQRDATYADIDSIKNNLPPKAELAVDSVVAEEWNLREDQYTPLDPLTSLDGINYIITSYTPHEPDGTWYQYDQTFDTQSAYVDTKNQLEWSIVVPNVNEVKDQFLLSNVHVDYRSMK